MTGKKKKTHKAGLLGFIPILLKGKARNLYELFSLSEIGIKNITKPLCAFLSVSGERGLPYFFYIVNFYNLEKSVLSVGEAVHWRVTT